MNVNDLPTPLPHKYYEQPTLDLARDLLGKTVWRRTGEEVVAGIIVEAEAYISAIDPASHNYRKPAPRAAVMFGAPGHAYVYLNYGMHHCLNVVAEPEGQSGGVLLRALLPTQGREIMAARCPKTAPRDLCRGPGRLGQALALTLADNGTDLTSDALWLSETPAAQCIAPIHIGTSPRIGITQGTDLPWRFFIRDCAAVSGPARLNR
jgi:DNA-3-methyladenine glycosylase